MGSNKPGSRVINYAAAVPVLVLCAVVSHADQGGFRKTSDATLMSIQNLGQSSVTRLRNELGRPDRNTR